jgi:hypothetical protein
LAQCDESAGGQPVFFEQLLHDLQVVAAWQIHRPCVPLAEAGLQSLKCQRGSRMHRLQYATDFVAIEGVGSPELQGMMAKHSTFAELHQLVENGARGVARENG